VAILINCSGPHGPRFLKKALKRPRLRLKHLLTRAVEPAEARPLTR
jgi:hypothetical protein